VVRILPKRALLRTLYQASCSATAPEDCRDRLLRGEGTDRSRRDCATIDLNGHLRQLLWRGDENGGPARGGVRSGGDHQRLVVTVSPFLPQVCCTSTRVVWSVRASSVMERGFRDCL